MCAIARLSGLDPSVVETDLAERMQNQLRAHGKISDGALIMARRPSIARSWAAMFAGIDASGLLPKALRHLVNRRVAMRVGCAY